MTDSRVPIPYTPRPYAHAPPPIPPQNSPPTPIFPQVADLVRLIESQIPKILLAELLVVSKCLEEQHHLVSNSHISDFLISRKNQEFSRGDSWFHVTWCEASDSRPGTFSRSINLRFEPGRQICTSYDAEDHPPVHPHGVTVRPEVSLPPAEPMELDPPPKPITSWSGLVGDLFDRAAGIAADQIRAKSPFMEEPSTALWPLQAWTMIKGIIWGYETSEANAVFKIPIP